MFGFDEAMEVMKHLEAVVDAGQELAQASVGMLIDMVCTRYGQDPVEFAQTVAECVGLVNETMGAYEEEVAL